MEARENYRLATRRGDGAALEKAKRNGPRRGRRGWANVPRASLLRRLAQPAGATFSKKAPTMIDDCSWLVPLPVRAFCRCSLENGGLGCRRRPRLRCNRRLNRNATGERDESGGRDDGGGG